jgi:endoglucanase
MRNLNLKNRLLMLVLAFLSLSMLRTYATSNEVAAPASDKYTVRENLTTQQLIEEMGVGINLGNTLDAGGDWFNQNNILNFETCWGAPVTTEKIIAGYANAGFNSLRIPVRWTNMMKNNIIHPTLLARVDSIVKWTLDNGMIAMINMHHVDFLWDYDYPATREEYRERFIAIWEQISERFKDYGDRLLFEPMNEIGFDRLWTPWSGTAASKKEAFGLVNELNQIFVDVVRASGGNNAKRHLVVEVYNTGLEYAYDSNFKMPNDPANRCAATVHYYTPAVFAILDKDADWGKARDTWGTAADFKELNDNMNNLKKNCVDKGIPIIVGEYAACGNNKTQAMKRLYAVSVTEAVYARGMCPMVWDTPGDQYTRTNQTFRDPLFIEEMMAIKVNHPRSPTNIRELSKSDIRMYPNPAKDQLTIISDFDSPVTLSFTDVTGKTVKTVKTVSMTEETIDISSLDAGIYIVRMQNRIMNYARKLVVE